LRISEYADFCILSVEQKQVPARLKFSARHNDVIKT